MESEMLALTLDPTKLAAQDSTKYINQVFADFRIYLKRKLGSSQDYIRVLEYHKTGKAHLHILPGGGYPPQQWVRRVDMHRISHYLSKYLIKQMLLHAPNGGRRVTTSRGIRLHKHSHTQTYTNIRLHKKVASDSKWVIKWVIVRIPIQHQRQPIKGLP